MPYVKRDGAGCKVERCTGTNLDWLGPWQVIPGFNGDITLPSGTPASWDATTHDDIIAGQTTKQKRAAIADVPDAGGTCLWDPGDTVHQAVLADMGTRQVRQYRFTPYGVTTPKYGAEAQVAVGPISATMAGGLTAQITLLVNKTNFNVA